MNIINNSLQKGYDNQKNSLLKESEEAGLSVVSFNEITSDDDKGSEVFKSTIKSLIGGKLAPDYWQVYTLSNKGVKQVYVQPFSGTVVLPGEHHGRIDSALSDALVLEDTAIFGGPVWSSTNKEFSKQLNKSEKDLKKIVKQVEFDWTIGTGKIEHEWAVQAYNIEESVVKLEMKAGRYGGITTYKVGFEVFGQLLQAFKMLEKASVTHQIPLKTSHYADMANSIMNIDATVPNVIHVNSVESQDLEALIIEFLSTRLDKQIFLNDIPEKKEKNLRRYVMADNYSRDKIVAAFDMTVMRSAKEGVVFTNTHCFAKEIDLVVAFELKDIVSLKSMDTDKDDRLEVILTSGSVLVPTGMHKEIIELFACIVKTIK